MSREQLYHTLFDGPRQGAARWRETIYRGPGAPQVVARWEHTKQWFLAHRHDWGPSPLYLDGFFRNFEEEDYAIQRQLEEAQDLKVQLWRTRKGIYRKKNFPDVRDVNMDKGPH